MPRSKVGFTIHRIASQATKTLKSHGQYKICFRVYEILEDDLVRFLTDPRMRLSDPWKQRTQHVVNHVLFIC
jgi:hypothetical protein